MTGKEGRTKTELLRHYAEREPTRFIQFDAFVHVEPGDDVVRPDADGDCLFGRMETWELMSGGPGVRVLIRPDVDQADVLRVLVKIRDWIVRDRTYQAFDYDPDDGLPY